MAGLVLVALLTTTLLVKGVGEVLAWTQCLMRAVSCQVALSGQIACDISYPRTVSEGDLCAS